MTDRNHKLELLLTRLVDSRKGFEDALESLENHALAPTIREFKQRRDRDAAELRAHLAEEGVEADDDGSLLATAHRVFMGLRDAVSAGDTGLLAEIVRGERALLEVYDDAIAAGSPTDPQTGLLTQQRRAVEAALGQLEANWKNAA